MSCKPWLIAYLVFMPAGARCESTTSVGRLIGIDGASRVITMADGSTFHVNKRVKMSARSVGEWVVITYRPVTKGREVMRMRRAPEEIDDRAAGASLPSP